MLTSFWKRIPENCSLEADESKIENLQFSTVFFYVFSRLAILERVNFHQNPLSEVNFLVILNWLEIWSILASKMTSKSILKIGHGWLVRPLGTPWGHLGDLLGPKVPKLTIPVDIWRPEEQIWVKIDAKSIPEADSELFCRARRA